MGVVGPVLPAYQIENLGEEQRGHVVREHALKVLGKDAVVNTPLAEPAVEEPRPEQVIAELLAEEPLAAHGAEGCEHAGLEQLPGQDGGPAQFLVQSGELLCSSASKRRVMACSG